LINISFFIRDLCRWEKAGKNIEIMESAVIFQEGDGSYARDDSGRLEIERLCRDLRAGEGSERILF